VGEAKPGLKKIVIFDDSKDALERFEEKMKGDDVKLLKFRSSTIEEPMSQKIKDFNPQLFMVDLLIGDSKINGYQLIRVLNSGEFKGIPIVVCSKFINETDAGKREKEECLSLPGVVAAFSKFPNFPEKETLFSYIRRDTR